MKKYFNPCLIVLLIAIAILTNACVPAGMSTPEAPGGSEGSFGNVVANIPQDTNVYTLEVTANDASTNYSAYSATGSSFSYNGYGSGSFRMQADGKGMIQVTIKSITPELDYVHIGKDMILKTVDLKIMAIKPGSTFIVKCRSQYENIYPISNLETFDLNKYSSYELDYCRMATPDITVEQK